MGFWTEDLNSLLAALCCKDLSIWQLASSDPATEESLLSRLIIVLCNLIMEMTPYQSFSNSIDWKQDIGPFHT